MRSPLCPRCKTNLRGVSRTGKETDYCPPCHSEMVKCWTRKNSDKVRHRVRAEYLKNPEKYRERSRIFRKKNPEKIKEQTRKYLKKYPDRGKIKYQEKMGKDPDKVRMQLKAWIKSNPEKIRAIQSRRRARRAGAGIVDRSITIEALCARDNWICGICGCQINKVFTKRSKYAPSIDHIIPLSKGGNHSWKNVQLAHSYCNSGKKDKILKQKTLPF